MVAACTLHHCCVNPLIENSAGTEGGRGNHWGSHAWHTAIAVVDRWARSNTAKAQMKATCSGMRPRVAQHAGSPADSTSERKYWDEHEGRPTRWGPQGRHFGYPEA